MKVRLKKHLLVQGRFIKAGVVEASSLPEWALDAGDLVERVNDLLDHEPEPDQYEEPPPAHWSKDPGPKRKIMVHKPPAGDPLSRR